MFFFGKFGHVVVMRVGGGGNIWHSYITHLPLAKTPPPNEVNEKFKL